jgi:Fe-S cluster biosynthesis and repair protein YggX
MTNTVFCEKLKKELPALSHSPFPGELGQRIIAHISKDAWDQWMGYQTMLINEYRLNMLEASARSFLIDEMKRYLFNEVAPDSDLTPPTTTQGK